MHTALLYSPRRRWLTWVALAFAIGIHLTAIVIARNRPDRAGPTDFDPIGGDVEVDIKAEIPPEPEPNSVPEQTPVNEDAFAEERPPAITPPKKSVLTPVRQVATNVTAFGHFGSAKTSAVYAPRPAYPYEARRQRITGNGIALLTVSRANGTVIDARMMQSTGSVILDNATTEAFRRWRFKPGSVESVQVPITFTLAGASY